MKHTQLKPLLYRLRHKYLTLNNMVIAAAFLIAISWVWGSLSVMQRNYERQQTLSTKQQQLALTELEVATKELEANYLRTPEFQKRAVKQSLGLVDPGEKVLILQGTTATPYVPSGISAQANTDQDSTVVTEEHVSNYQQWMRFLFGGVQTR